MNDINEVKDELDPEEIFADVVLDDEVRSDNEEPIVEEAAENIIDEIPVSEEAPALTEEVIPEEASALEENETVSDGAVEAEVADEVAEAEVADDAAEAEETDDISVSLEEYKTILYEHFQNLRALIKYTKTKDETIQKLSGELQKYREDYCAKAFKSIATLLISFREDCRKSLSDLDSYDLTFDKAKKFLGFLADDLEELLSNAGCEEEDHIWTFNGKPLTVQKPTSIKFPELFVIENSVEDSEDTIVGNNLKEYLVNAEMQIKAMLADNEKLDKCLKDYCVLASAIENDVVSICVYPPIRKMIALYHKTRQMVDDYLLELNEDNMVNCYYDVLTFLIDQIEDILLIGGVRIDTTVDNMFDTKKNRLIRAIVTDDASKDRIIAKQYTECYMMNDIVLYPAKVDVYKYQA